MVSVTSTTVTMNAPFTGTTTVGATVTFVSGRSEFTPISYSVVPQAGYTQAPGSNFYSDINMQSAPISTNAANQEGYLSGVTAFVQKWSPGNVIDPLHQGSWGLSIFARPGTSGWDGNPHTSDTTYPMNALAFFGGWSGLTSGTGSGGWGATATPAALVGVQIGGPNGSVWNPCTTCNSYIPIGLQIQDYTTEAVHITAPRTTGGFSGAAIITDTSSGGVQIGDNVAVGTTLSPSIALNVVQAGNIEASFASTGSNAAQIFVNDSAGAQSASINLQDAGATKWALTEYTDNSLYLSDSAAGMNMLHAVTNGNLTLGDAQNFVISNAGSVSIGTSAVVSSSLNLASGFSYDINSLNALRFPTSDTTAGASIAIGPSALSGQTVSSGYSNIAIGYQALNGTMTSAAIGNTAVGYQACDSVTSGLYNTCMGYASGLGITTGQQNFALGYHSMQYGGGNYNVAIGQSSLFKATGGINVGIGPNAGAAITTGSSNVAVGPGPGGTTLTTGSNNILIGTNSYTDTQTASSSNTMNIGNLLYGAGMTQTSTAAAGTLSIGTATNPFPSLR